MIASINASIFRLEKPMGGLFDPPGCSRVNDVSVVSCNLVLLPILFIIFYNLSISNN